MPEGGELGEKRENAVAPRVLLRGAAGAGAAAVVLGVGLRAAPAAAPDETGAVAFRPIGRVDRERRRRDLPHNAVSVAVRRDRVCVGDGSVC